MQDVPSKFGIQRRLKRPYTGLLLAFCLSVVSAYAFDHSFAEYDSVLTKYVADGRMNYQALCSDRTHLDRFLSECAALSFDEYQTFQRNQQLAFMLNFYNAAAMALICDHPAIRSLNELKSIFSDAWSVKFAQLFDHTVSLSMVMHDILRSEFKDTRIHFALVIGANSDPELLNAPYRAEILDQQLDRQTDKFMLARPELNFFENGTLHLSPLFKWYAVDFGKRDAVLRFAGRYYPDVTPRTRIQYSQFDWSINTR